ncbi:hypothetical protein PC114_g17288 [Phytophthora cactorum]|uniref:Uncharacterized protein n=1 Tax=Phytophthora cactorum TaxID=29920 RepID=A0A8T1CF32_9STRA|nr:hypothetical protein PC114_g17288 [Phytophthora cactorum]KAG2920319.1 hypothetical protein PC117_g16521 [Phytophthora cactorum]
MGDSDANDTLVRAVEVTRPPCDAASIMQLSGLSWIRFLHVLNTERPNDFARPNRKLPRRWQRSRWTLERRRRARRHSRKILSRRRRDSLRFKQIDDETTGSLVSLGPVLNLNDSGEGSLGGSNKDGRESAHDLASAHLNGATPRIAATISVHGVRAHTATKVAASDVIWPLSPSVATTATPFITNAPLSGRRDDTLQMKLPGG